MNHKKTVKAKERFNEEPRFVTQILQDTSSLDPKKAVKATLRFTDTGIWVRFKGYASYSTQEEHGYVIFIKIEDGNPICTVLPNINDGWEAVHTSLKDAKITCRQKPLPVPGELQP